MRILQIIPDFDARFGGPVNSAASVSEAFSVLGHESLTIAADGSPDAWGSPARAFGGIRIPWLPRPVSILSISMLWWLFRSARSYDAVHIHLNRSVSLLPAGLILRLL